MRVYSKRLYNLIQANGCFETIIKNEIKIIEFLTAHIKEQIGVTLELDDNFTGIRNHKGKPYFNAILAERIFDSVDCRKLVRIAGKHNGITAVEPNGSNRIAIFFNPEKVLI